MGLPQKFAVSLGGVGYQFRVTWCQPSNCWVLDISDASGAPIANGLPFITGAGLLEQLQYLGIPGELLVQTDNDADAVPTFDNLGTLGRLYYFPFVHA